MGMWLRSCKGILNQGKFCLWNPESRNILLMEFGFWALKSKIHLNESGTQPIFEVYLQVPRDKESRIHCLESGIQDCLGFPYMVQEVHSNDLWVFSKMADHPLRIIRSSPLSKMACETTFPPWGNFFGSFFVVGILLKNLRWLIYSFQMKTIDFFKVENFYQPQASMALYWTINHCNWRKLSFYLLKTFYC